MAKKKAPAKTDNVSKEKKNYVRFKYTEEELINAVYTIKNKDKSLNQVNKDTGIPKSTLSNKVNNKVPILRKMGPNTILSLNEEDKIVKWILAKAKVGFPVHPENIKDSIQKVLKSFPRKNPFNDDRPGKKWLNSFLNRHQEIGKRHTEIISKARAAVTENSIRLWFDGVSSFLKEEGCSDILCDSRRIINCDETGIQLCPKTGKVLGPKKMNNFYEIAKNSEKENITVLCTYSANGSVLPPMIIYPYKRIPNYIYQSVPENWGIGRSDSGWMVSATFFEYIANIMYPWLVDNEVDFPVILYLDGHKSHLSLELSEFCTEKKIILYCLPPNATHILQPCDVSIFKPLKSYWKDVIKAHNLISKSPITKNNFGNIFKDAFDKVKPESIINGFKACGMFPFNPDAVDYTKCIPNRQAEVDLMFQEQHAQDYPSKDEYFVCQKVIKYILKNHTIHNILSNEPFLEKIWNTCNVEIAEITNKSSFGSEAFNILDMPIELEGSNFSFDEEVMKDLGVQILNSNSVYEEEHLNTETPPETFQFLNEQVSNIYNQIDRQRIQYSGEKNIYLNKEDCIIVSQIGEHEVEYSCVEDIHLDNEDCNRDPLTEQKLQCSGEEGVDLGKERFNVVPHIEEQDMQNLNMVNCNINVLLDEQETQHSNEKHCNTVSPTNKQEDVQCLDSIKASNSSFKDVWDNHFSWPKEEIKEKKRQKAKIPYAITSTKWKDIQIDKEEKKLEKETLILKRKNERLLKKNNIDNKRKTENVKPNSSTKKQKVLKESTKFKKNFSVGDNVMVQYEGEFYPGIIEEKKKKELKVSKNNY